MARGLALGAAAIGASNLLGWSLDLVQLRSFLPGLAAMSVSTGLEMVLAAAATAYATAERATSSPGASAASGLVLVLLASGAGLGQDVVEGSGFLADSDGGLRAPAVMATGTAAGFILIGLALLLAVRGRRPAAAAAQCLALAVLGGAMFVLTAYAFDARALYQDAFFDGMALPTALGFALLGIALLCVRPQVGGMAVVSAHGTGGTLARRLIPVATLIPFLIGYPRLLGERSGLCGFEFGIGLLSVADTVVLVAAILAGARLVESIDANRRTAERRAREGEERLNLALVSAGGGTWNWDMASGRVVWDQPRHLLFGREPSTFAGTYEAFKRLLVPEDRERVTGEVRESVARGVRYKTEFQIVRPDGTRRSIAAAGKGYRDASGRPLSMTGICWDVTERNQAQAQVQRLNKELERRVQQRTRELEHTNARLQEEIEERERSDKALKRYAFQLRRLSDAAIAVNSSRDLAQVIDHVTESPRTIIGAHQAVTSFTVDQDMAQAIHAVSLSDKYADYRECEARPDGSGIYAMVCESDRTVRMTQEELEVHPCWRTFGSEASRHRPMRGWLAAPLIGRDGRNLGLIQVSDRDSGEFTESDEAVLVQLAQLASEAAENAELDREIEQKAAEIQRLNQALEQRVSQLEAANKELESFSYSVSHDLRAPLRHVNGFAELLAKRAEGSLDERSQHYLDTIGAAGCGQPHGRAHRRPAGLLPGRSLAAQMEPVPARRGSTGGDPRTDAGARRPELGGRDVEWQIDELPEIEGDRSLVALVFTDLLSNATKYTSTRDLARIHIGVRPGPDGHAVVFVQDNGVGFDMRYSDKVFAVL